MNYQLHNEIHEFIMVGTLLCLPIIVIGGLITIKTERFYKLGVLLGLFVAIVFTSAAAGFASVPALVVSVVAAVMVPKRIKSAVSYVFWIVSLLLIGIVYLNMQASTERIYSLVGVTWYESS